MIRYSNGWLEEYHEKAMCGDILVGQELKTEICKLIKDLDDERYVYDTRAADLRIDFMENCIKRTLLHTDAERWGAIHTFITPLLLSNP